MQGAAFLRAIRPGCGQYYPDRRRAETPPSSALVPSVTQHADLETNDGVFAREERRERGAIVLGGAAAPHARDEALELLVTPAATAETELPCFDDHNQPVDGRVDIVVGDAGSQVAEQLEAELLELADALLLAEPLVLRDGP